MKPDEGNTGVENRIETFIEYNRKICWESEYEKGEFCIGENKVRRFCQEISSKQNAALIAALKESNVKIKELEKACHDNSTESTEYFKRCIELQAALKELIPIAELCRQVDLHDYVDKHKSIIERAKKLTDENYEKS